MHPAFSVIVFTTASGAGYGLLILLGLFSLTGHLPAERAFGFTAFVLALGLVTGGLLTSTLHLGRPERAWRAVTQWRTSWLSREGIAALLTYLPALIFAAGWLLAGRRDGPWALAALLAALGAIVTLVCTGMIYASLKPIQRWHNDWVVPNYLALGLMTGGILLDAVTRLFGIGHVVITLTALVLIVIAAGLKRGYWRFIDETAGTSTPGSATGLGVAAAVTLLAAPNTEENYLQREMGFQVARKHAAKLRRIAGVAGFAVPFALLAVSVLLGGGLGALASLLAVPAAGLGVLVERWLFFAEARHTVMLYYGASTA